MSTQTPPLPPSAPGALPDNRVWLSVTVLERGATRYTPAGLPALDFVLRHDGQAFEAGGLRKVSLEIRAVALGPVAQSLDAWSPGQTGHVAGFLAAMRNGKGVVLHITEFSIGTSPAPNTE